MPLRGTPMMLLRQAGIHANARTCPNSRLLLVDRVEAGGRCDDGQVRIGTWNLDGRWSDSHMRFLDAAGCDAWLLTEVEHRFELTYGELVRSGSMGPSKSYAAVWADGRVHEVPALHEASAAAAWGDVLLCSTVLPWRSCGSSWPDVGPDIASKTVATLNRLRPGLASSGQALIWGGDWNNALWGANHAGTAVGLAAIRTLSDDLNLQVPTAHQPHAMTGLFSIDHVAVPAAWLVLDCQSIEAQERGKRLSDHDAYLAGRDALGLCRRGHLLLRNGGSLRPRLTPEPDWRCGPYAGPQCDREEPVAR